MGAQMKNTNHESKHYSLLASSREVIRLLTSSPDRSGSCGPAASPQGARSAKPAGGEPFARCRPHTAVRCGERRGEMGHFVKMAAATDRFTKRARKIKRIMTSIGLSLNVPYFQTSCTKSRMKGRKYRIWVKSKPSGGDHSLHPFYLHPAEN